MNQKFYNLIAFLLLLSTQVIAQTEVTISDTDLEGGQTYNWTSDNVYLLDGFVFLEAGGTLNIEAGTVIKGLATPSTGDNASALIISRDAQIFAEGTAEAPIIFTAESDDLSVPDDLLPTDRGLWGGLIVLGNAAITANTPTKAIEGIPAGDDRAVYGGDDDADNSGVIRYISIRHGGAALAEGNEINGLTLGAVGSETQIDHVEVFANFDDGIEWFGGTVSIKYAAVAWCGDDSFDWDQGWRGNGQFWFSLQGNDTAGNGAEQDGAGDQDSNSPVSNPSIYNATYIGSGADTDPGVGNDHALLFRDASAGSYSNSIFTDFAQFAIQVEDTGDPFDSRSQMINGELVLQNNLWFGFGAGDELTQIINPTEEDGDVQFLINHLTLNTNELLDPQIANIDRFENLDPRPDFSGPAYQTALADLPDDDFFTRVRFKGAFCNDGVWIQNWTALAQSGILDTSIDLSADNCDELVAVGGERIIRDEDLEAGGTYTWSKDTVYLLDGFVFLETGGTLNIEEGTVIKGLGTPSTGDNASALIISRNAQIFAEGTVVEPIIFTAENDDLSVPDDLLSTDRGLWGGLIILGNATITADTPIKAIEGIPAGDDRALYGGDDDTDNSGVIRYISIRHGGAALAEGNEINGLTLGAVGSDTQIDHVEVFANFDDGIEWFGGTVSVKYATVAWCGDDSFDWDQGWRGEGQFWFSLQGNDTAGNGAEQDGAGDQDSNTPVSNPTIYNATYIGSGAATGPSVGNDHALLFRDASAGSYSNSIFTDFAQFAIQVEDTGDPFDSRSQMISGVLVLENNLWFGFGAGDELSEIINPTEPGGDVQFLIDHLANNNNQLDDPMIANIDRFENLDPRPNFGGPAYQSTLADFPDSDFFTPVRFKGAFCNDGVWIQSWTALAQSGILDPSIDLSEDACDELVPVVGERIIKDDDLLADETYNWSKDTTYILDGFVFLEAGGTLNIEEGTVIKALGTPTTGDNASALIIARDAQIFAEGTFEEPIIFTAENDDIDDPADLLPTDRGLWGGLIILGNATITADTPVKAIEGIPAGDDRAVYGGDDDTDNSGVIRFVSIRHGGAALAEGNEINGLTLGGVGSGTQIDHIEVFANFDDGIEWFGGTVDVKYAAVSWCGDDSFDWDQGYRGRGQYWFSIQGNDTAGNGAEQDGAGDQDSNEPVSNPLIYNATYIGSGANAGSAVGNDHALLFRDASAGTYGNSIFTDFAQFALQVEDTGDPFDSRSRMINGELNLLNNLWFGFGAGDELSEIINPTDPGGDIQFAIDHLSNNDNQLVDPLINSIDRFGDGLLDPRTAIDGPAYATTLAAVPQDGFYDNVIFKGAFCSEGTWIQSWTALAQNGVLDAMIPYVGEGCELSTSTDEILTESNGYLLKQSVPNPASDRVTIDFTVPRMTTVSLTVYSSDGRIVAQPINNDTFLSGEHRLEFNVSNLPNGIYFYNLRNAEVSITKAIVVDKR